MSRHLRIPFLLLCLASWLWAADTPAPVELDRLELTNGRTLKKVVVKAYDTKEEKFLLVADNKAMLLDAALVPAPLRESLKQNVPEAGSSTSSTAPPAEPPPPPPKESAPPAAPAADLPAHKQAALERARNYYRFEFQTGAAAGNVTAVNFEMDDPESVPGWTGRYRTCGRALLEYFDSAGYSYNRTSDRFEVLTEQKPGGSIKVVDFTRK